MFFLCSISSYNSQFSDMTAKWSEIPAAEKTDLIELEMRLVISRSSQWPWTWVIQTIMAVELVSLVITVVPVITGIMLFVITSASTITLSFPLNTIYTCAEPLWNVKLSFTTLYYFCINHAYQSFVEFEIMINVLVSSYWFILIRYRSTTIRNKFFQCGDRLHSLECDVYIR